MYQNWFWINDERQTNWSRTNKKCSLGKLGNNDGEIWGNVKL